MAGSKPLAITKSAARSVINCPPTDTGSGNVPGRRARPQPVKCTTSMASAFTKFLAFALGLVICGIAAFTVHADDDERLLEGVEYRSVNGKAVIAVRFATVTAYVKHFPASRGNTLEIQLRTPAPRGGGDSIRTEALLAPQSAVIPLAGVSFDGTDSANQLVIIRFTRPMAYKVALDEDQRGLLVTLPEITYLGPDQEMGGGTGRPTLMTLEDLGASKEDEAAGLMASGRAQLAAGNFSEAVRLFSRVLDLPDHSLAKEAEAALLTARAEEKRLAAQLSQVSPLDSRGELVDMPAAETPSTVAAGISGPTRTEAPSEPSPITSEAPSERVATPIPEPSSEPPSAASGPEVARETPIAANPKTAASSPSSTEPTAAAPQPALESASKEKPVPAARPLGPNAEIERQLEFGQVAMDRGDYRTAMRIFSIVVATAAAPYKSQAQTLLAQAEAAADAEPAPADNKPSQAQTWLQQAETALRSGNAKAAASLAQRVMASGEASLQTRAEALLKQARQAEASAVLRKPLSEPDTTAQAPPASAEPTSAEPAAEPNASDPPVGDAAALLEQGMAAMKANQLQTAIDAFSAILTMPVSPETAEAERLLRLAKRQQAERAAGDLRGPIMGEPATLEDVARIMEQGMVALNEADHNRAIVAFTKLTTLPNHPHSKDALEMLGVARQRNNQLAHAKAAFQDYLKKYPEGEDAVRVKQRLADLISSQLKPQDRLPTKGTEAPSSAFKTDVFGSVSQYYYYGLIEVEDFRPGREDEEEETQVREDQNMLISYVTANSRSRSDRYEIRSFLYGTHTVDFIDEEDPQRQGTRMAFSNLYADVKDKKLGLYGRLGRQSSTTAGVLGRFDGLHVAYDWRPKTHFNTAVGFPVNLNDKDSIDFPTSFATFNVEFEEVLKGLDIVPYVSVQQSEGLLDRIGVGEEIRYFSPRGSLFNLLDYEASYGQLNIFLLHGQLNLTKRAIVHLNLDYRNTPLIGTRNALINEIEYRTLEELQEVFTEDEIRGMAEDKTGKSTIATVGGSYSFTEQVQISGDLSWSRQQYSTESITDSPTLVSQEDALTAMLRLTATGLLWGRDMYIIGAAFTAADNYDNSNWLFQTRAPFGEGWAIDGILRLDLREDLKGEKLTRTRPSLKLGYNWKRKVTLEMEGGVEISEYDGNTLNQNSNRTFGTIGYRWNF